MAHSTDQDTALSVPTRSRHIKLWFLLVVLLCAVAFTAWWFAIRPNPPLQSKDDQIAWLQGRYRGNTWGAVWLKNSIAGLQVQRCSIQRTPKGQRGSYLNVQEQALAQIRPGVNGVQYAAASNAQFFNPLVRLPVGSLGTGTPGQWYNSPEHTRRWAFGFAPDGRFRLDRIVDATSSRIIRRTFPYGMTGIGCLGTSGRYRQVVNGEDVFSYRGNDWVNEARDRPDSGPSSRRARTMLAWTVKPDSPTVIDNVFLIVSTEKSRKDQTYDAWTWTDAQHFCFDRYGGLNGPSLLETIIACTDEDPVLKRNLAATGIHTALMLDGGGMSQLYYVKTDAHGAKLPGYPKSIENGGAPLGVPSLVCAYRRGE